MIMMIIQFNSYLLMCKLNSSEANYKVNTSKEEEEEEKKMFNTL
jgi:hypothetical protein